MKSYTPEERDARRRRSSLVRTSGSSIRVTPRHSSERIEVGTRGSDAVAIENIETVSRNAAAADDDEESWIADLRAQGVDVSAFLQDAIPPEYADFLNEDGKGKDQPTTSISEADKHRNPPEAEPTDQRRSSFLRASLPNGKKITLMRRSSSCLSDATNDAKRRFSSFLDEAYVINSETGEAVINSIEDADHTRKEKEIEQDVKNFDPDGTSDEERKVNRDWAIKMAIGQAEKAGFEKKESSNASSVQRINGNGDYGTSHPPSIYEKCVPPPTQPLPSLEVLGLDPRHSGSSNPREIGTLPPFLPENLLADIVPRRARNHLGGISDGMLVYGTSDEGWELCDSDHMVVGCVNTSDSCGSFLRCSREASLVRCPKCNTVSPVGPELASLRRSNSKSHLDEMDGDMGSTGAIASYGAPNERHPIQRRKSSLSSAVTTVGWGG